MAPPVGMLIGHSFVQGLQQHLDPRNQASPSEMARKLSVHRIIHSFHFYGQRGAQVCSRSFVLPHRLLTHTNPDFVILDLGSNDLASGIPPFQVATKLLELADILRSRYHVNTVIIASVLHRETHLRHITPAQFSTAAYQTNNYLKNFADTHPHVFYHLHKGFWAHPSDTWSRDGVHPNTQAGRKKYVKSVRKAVFAALQTFTSR